VRSQKHGPRADLAGAFLHVYAEGGHGSSVSRPARASTLSLSTTSCGSPFRSPASAATPCCRRVSARYVQWSCPLVSGHRTVRPARPPSATSLRSPRGTSRPRSRTRRAGSRVPRSRARAKSSSHGRRGASRGDRPRARPPDGQKTTSDLRCRSRRGRRASTGAPREPFAHLLRSPAQLAREGGPPFLLQRGRIRHGTTLLALVTGALAYSTRSEVRRPESGSFRSNA
jgi:hypothetical protein